MRVAFLTNSLLSTDSIHRLSDRGYLKGVGSVASNPLLCRHIARLADARGLVHTQISKANLEIDLIAWMEAVQPDMVVVQTFPFKIPASCLRVPAEGFYNVHPGLLPEYRGPDPVFWQLKNGEQHLVLTLHKMDADYDTGPVALTEQIPIEHSDTYGMLNSVLASAVPEVLDRFLSTYTSDCALVKQPASASFQKKPSADDLLVDWAVMTGHQIYDLVRACNPNHNGCITFFRNVITRILEVELVEPEFDTMLTPGTVISADRERGIQVICVDNKALRLDILHVDEGYYSGRRFIAAFNVQIGDRFSLPTFEPGNIP